MKTLSKKYSPADVEDKWYSAWLEAGVFHSEPDERPSYTITIPPPNVTGILHMGHVLNNTLQDVLVRRKRMEGYNACWVPGTDHASIATEAKVVNMLAEKGITKQDLTREAFLEYAFQWKDKYGGIILKQLRKLGCSCDWERTSFTMDEEYSRSVIEVFCRLYNKGLIYRGVRMVNWDPSALTAISDEEVKYKTTQGNLYHIRYPIKGSDESVIIATTRPETLLGDTAVAIHPEDERYTHLHEKKAVVPLVDREVPIIQDTYVKTDFGTGCLKVTPAHDVNDYELGLTHDLEVINILNDNGTISEAGKLFVGEDRFVVRKKIVKLLKEKGYLEKVEPYTHEVGHSERTDAPIEPKLSLQWFLKMKALSAPALEAVLEGDIRLIPEKFINTYRHWMENVRDWCLSRQLWWGHRIPAYYIQGSNAYVVAATEKEALKLARKKTGDNKLQLSDLEQDPDVLDTWASSWLWPISVFDGITRPDNPDIKYYYPTNDLVTAPEILFFWVARMIIAGYEIMGERPFQNVYLTGIVRDDQRRKMSKSLGNSPDPLDMIKQYGADGVRLGMLRSAPAGNDLLFSEKEVEEGRNFCNKLWNSLRLIKGWEITDQAPTDREQLAVNWMRHKIREGMLEVQKYFETFRISDAAMSIFKLIRDEFSQWYLEMVKPPYGEAISAETVSHTNRFFEQLLQLLHPFMPFITEEIWHQLEDRDEGDFLTTLMLPTAEKPDAKHLAEFELIKEVTTALRAFRTDNGFATKESIELYIKTDDDRIFKRYEPILARFLQTDTVQYITDKIEQAGSIRVQTHQFFIPLKKVDIEAEREKILKEIDYFEGFLSKTQKKLSNEKFVQNAPEQVVALEKKKQADAEAKLEVLKESLSQFN